MKTPPARRPSRPFGVASEEQSHERTSPHGRGAGNGQFNRPQGIAVDRNGNVFVADTGQDRIQKFTSTGTFLATWGSTGTQNGQFDIPFGVAVDGDGNVFVGDFNNRIQKFACP
jgi:DNA-binding beta-propeller fold protein YncE